MKALVGLLTVAQLKTSVVDPLVWRVQAPGPSKGTSTCGEPGVSSPASAPLNAGALGTGATDLAVESVTLAKLLSAGGPVVGGVGVVEVVVVGAGRERVVVVVVGAGVALNGVVVGVIVGAAVVRGPDVVSAKTRTSSSTGLDHINRCALFREV